MAEIPLRQRPGDGLVLPPAPGNGLVLALDAGSPLVSVAVGRGGDTLAMRAVPQQRSSTQLLALVAEALAELGARPADLAGVVALAGPGSFTGLRVALATALGFHQALGLPALAAPTLAAMAAASDAPAGGLAIAAGAARRGEGSVQAVRPRPVAAPRGARQRLPAAGRPRRLSPAWRPPPSPTAGRRRCWPPSWRIPAAWCWSWLAPAARCSAMPASAREAARLSCCGWRSRRRRGAAAWRAA